MADNGWENAPDFEPADVSKPVEPRREADILAEERAAYRREWIRSHMTYIFIAIGVIAVALVFVVIHFYNQSANPINRLVSASGKDFGVPFDFSVTVSKDDEAVMSYSGSVDINNRKHSARIAYDADYNDYSYKGIVFADKDIAVKGYYYNDKWTVRDCSEQIANFFDFDTDYRRGEFDAGSFLRFTGLTSRYSAKQLSEFVPKFKDRLASDSEFASISIEKSGSDTGYVYDFDPAAFFEMIKSDGASLFSSADDYNDFIERLDLSAGNLRSSDCEMSFTIDPRGYLTDFSFSISMPEHSYSISCKMSSFNMAVTKIPADFLETATITPSEE